MCEFESEKEERTNKCRIDCNIVLKFKKKMYHKSKEYRNKDSHPENLTVFYSYSLLISDPLYTPYMFW